MGIQILRCYTRDVWSDTEQPLFYLLALISANERETGTFRFWFQGRRKKLFIVCCWRLCYWLNRGVCISGYWISNSPCNHLWNIVSSFKLLLYLHVQYSTCVDPCLHIKFSSTNLSGRSQQNHSLRATEKEPFTVRRREKVQSEQHDSISHFVHSRLKRWLSICSVTSHFVL